MASSRPASRLEVFDVLAPAGTPQAAPLEVDTSWIDGELVGLELVIPAGHNGLTGIQLALAHSQVIPATRGSWIVGNDEVIGLDTLGYPDTGAWSAFVYNTDNYDHTFHVRYEVADFVYLAPPDAQPLLPTPLVT